MANTPNLNLEIIDLTTTPNKTVEDWKGSLDGNMNIIDTAYGQVVSNISSKQDQLKVFSNVTASNWVSDNTYADYSYKCDITCTGITANSVVDVIFDVAEATSGNYAPVCMSSANTVTIYSKVSTSITIPIIKEI